jgi:hypothetical protein
MACNCNSGGCTNCKKEGGRVKFNSTAGRRLKFKRGGKIKEYNSGGYLVGPSHEDGGIIATIQNGGQVELEGGEYIINAQTVNAVGIEFLDQLNSTATTYHQGGYNAGQLPNPSNYRRGGRIKKQNGGIVYNPSDFTPRVENNNYIRIVENLQTSGGEYTCQTNNHRGCGAGPNGTYSGPMHYHPEIGYMVGARHVDESHSLLVRYDRRGGGMRNMKKGGLV